METTIKLYAYVDGVNDTPFPSVEHQIKTGAFTYNASRMGGAPTISFDAYYPTCLDDVWTKNVYAEFNGEKYFLSKIPTSSYDNTAITYKHSVELVSERVALENVYFYDVVSTLIDDKPVSNSSIVNFSGDIHQFVARLNHSLIYAKLQTVDENGNYVSGYRVMVDDGVESEEHFMSFEDEFFANVLQEIYNVYEIPYYFVGKDIHIGYNAPDINTLFSYGSDNALLSISKTNANFRVITRATGEGSEENIPFYYPNQTPLGDVSLDTISGATVATIKDVNKFGGSGLLDKTLTYIELPTSTLDFSSRYELNGNITNGIPQSVKIQGEGDYDDVIFLRTYIKQENIEGQNVYVNWQWYLKNKSTGSGSTDFGDIYIGSETTGVWLSVDGGKMQPVNDFYVHIDQVENEDIGELIMETSQRVTVPVFVTSYHFYEVYIGVKLRVVDKKYTRSAELSAVNTIRAGYYGESGDIQHGWLDADGKQYDLEKYGIVLNQEPSVGDSFKVNLVRRWDVQKRLMPSIYRESNEQERFYNAIDGAYTDDLGNEIVFANTYSDSNRKEQIVEFSDIKPTIEEMTNGSDERIDMFLEFAYDENDNDETEEINGSLEYKHPYFFGKLRKFDGDNGFNLFDHAIENGEMTIEMTSGSCGACKFVIAVDEENQKNTVQVYEENFTDEDGVFHAKGSLKRDKDGNVRCGRENYQAAEVPQGRQQDTKNYEVWVALRKDVDTFGVIMPHSGLIEGTDVETTAKYRPKSVTEDITNGGDGSGADTFVITNIHLPHGYITNAEKKLEEEIIKYLVENNDEKFNFAIKFSRIYLAENSDILALLNENTKLHINYNNSVYDLYVSSYSYKMSDNEALPEITVELTDTLSIRQNAIQKAVSTVEGKIMDTIGSGTGVSSWQSLIPYFLQKNRPDVAEKKITFREGVEFGEYNSGALGTGGAIGVDGNGNTVAELDFLTIRKKATFKEITIQELKNVGGELVLSPAAMECSSVTELEDVYRCYFEKQSATGEQIDNEFVVGDQVRCQTFNLNGNRYYWRLVTSVGEDYIDLSKDDCDANSDAPLAGDKIAVLGNRNGGARQAAIILSAYGANSPSMTQYAGIDSYSLVGKMVTKFSNGENVVTGTMKILPNSEGAANFTDLNVGNYNLLRNSGFTGDYLSEELTDERVLEAKSEMFSAPFDYWTVDNAEVVASTEETPSQSGFVVEISDGSLEQTLYYDILPNEKYVFSLRGKSESNSEVSIEVGGTISTILLDGEWKRHSVVFETTSAEKNFKISCADCVICELQLERGTIASAWGNSYLDNSSDRAYWQSMRYMQDAISEASTTVNGGLVLTQLIQVGDYDKDTKEMVKTTGGVSGLYNNVDSNVAFWSGGDLAKAKNTVEYYKANGKESQPTQEEIAQMAKFVVTHGGLAILNDIILRGYVYADGGVFNGTVNATDGVFNGTVYANSGVFSGVLLKTKTIITAENKANFEITNHGFTYIDITKVGTFVECQTDCDFWFGGTIHIPEGTALNKEYIEEQLALVGNEVIICKSSDDINVTMTGSTISKELVVIEDSLSDYQFKVVESYFGSSSVIRNANQFAYARCIITDKYNYTQSAIAWEWKVVNFN